jgi:hypothetical protein
MKILKTGTDQQTLTFIPRAYSNPIVLTLRDDQTNEVVTYTINGNIWQYQANEWNLSELIWNVDDNSFLNFTDYMVISHSFDLREGHYYDLTVKTITGAVIHLDKIFCTDQDIDESLNQYYSINEGEYIQDQNADNDFIIL